MADITFSRFTGLNDTDPPTTLGPEECTEVENIDFWQAPCGGRRLGSTPVTLNAALDAEAAIIFLHRHLPTAEESDAQLWAAAVTYFSSVSIAYKTTVWNNVTPIDALTNSGGAVNLMKAQTLHGKLFFAYISAQDRLHVWDGTTLRRTGLAEPAAPTVAETGVGTYSGIRYFRVRYTVQAAGVTIRRSEPSDSTMYDPATFGSNGLAARITKPASISEAETHWEVEASLDNANFYRIATVVVGTTTYDDSTSFSTGYAVAGVLSEDIGDYSLIPSARFLAADQDRLLYGGSFVTADRASTVGWTPVLSAPGVGNDERVPTDTDNELNLDGYEGGAMTGFGGPINGVVFVFKFGHIYRLARTNQASQAYEPVTVSKIRGAIEGSIVEGVDEAGRPALYFLDPNVGPCRIGSGGLLWCGGDIYETWRTVNTDASLVAARGVFYKEKQQVHWWVPTGSASQPDLRITLQTNLTRVTVDGVRGGYARHSGQTTLAVATCMFATNIEANTARSRRLKPFAAIGGTVQMLDTGNLDNSTTYIPRLVSAPFAADPLHQSGVRVGAVVAGAAASAILGVGLIRDFGVQTAPSVAVPLAPVGTENPVIKDLDSLALSELKAAQLLLEDGVGNANNNWQIHRVDLGTRMEQSS